LASISQLYYMAIAYRQRIDDDTEFALWRIEEPAAELYAQLQLSESEKAVVERLKSGKRHLHWLGTRVLLRTMLSTNEYIDCQVDNHGKPYLVNHPYYISFSHSFDYAAVMISRKHQVGIDIELIKEKVERIAYKFMKTDELAFISPNTKIEQLYACWCAKEAIYKCYGQKEVSFLDDIALQPFKFEGHGLIQASLQKNDISINYDLVYQQFEDYMIGYVIQDKA
jgi:4'-phosphopantetheinyl transferase